MLVSFLDAGEQKITENKIKGGGWEGKGEKEIVKGKEAGQIRIR